MADGREREGEKQRERERGHKTENFKLINKRDISLAISIKKKKKIEITKFIIKKIYSHKRDFKNKKMIT